MLAYPLISEIAFEAMVGASSGAVHSSLPALTKKVGSKNNQSSSPSTPCSNHEECIKICQVRTDYTRTLGLLNFVFAIATLVGPLLRGILTDTTGTYLAGDLVLTALGLLGAFVLFLVHLDNFGKEISCR